MFTQNFIKLSAALYELSCSQTKNSAKKLVSSLPRTVITRSSYAENLKNQKKPLENKNRKPKNVL